jgi:two-component system NarL family response regulator
MPEMGGLAIMNRLRDQLPELKVVILTATEDVGPLLDAVSAGAQGYLHKRATAEELRHAVITAHGGGSVVSPDLARHLMAEFSSRTRGVSGTRGRPAMADREVEVLRLVVQGKTDVEIGNALYISPRTVQNHLTRIREKTGLRRRSELTRWAVEQSFV